MGPFEERSNTMNLESMKETTGRFLVTTAYADLEALDQPLLLLGKWCEIYSRRYALEKKTIK